MSTEKLSRSDFVTVTEYRSPDGSLILWSIVDRTQAGAPVYTNRVCVRSPLTGAWLADTDACGLMGSDTPCSNRYEPRRRRKGRKNNRGASGTLRLVRALNVPGNGKAHGGHSSIDQVSVLPNLAWLLRGMLRPPAAQ